MFLALYIEKMLKKCHNFCPGLPITMDMKRVLFLLLFSIYSMPAGAFPAAHISSVQSGNFEGAAHHGLIIETPGIADPNLTSYEIQIKPDSGGPFPPWKVYSTEVMPQDGQTINVPYRNGTFALVAGERYCVRLRAVYGNSVTAWSDQCGIDLTDRTFSSDDSDSDGLSDDNEYAIATDPFDPDSDGDGTNDGTEVANGTNPNDLPLFPDLLIRTAGIDFGEGDIFGNRRNQHQYIEIQNVGDAPAHIDSIVVHADAGSVDVFHVGHYPHSLTNIPPDDTLRIPVSFIPTASGPVSAHVEIQSNNPTPLADIPLTGTGDDRVPTCGVSPAVLDFGTVDVEDQAASVKYVTLSNNPPASDLPFEFTLSSTVDSMAPGLRQYSLKPGEEINIPVFFQHAEPGSYEGFLEIHSAYCGVQKVTLKGTAE